MRNLPTRKGWTRDRLSLLANPSPPPSPSPFGTSDPNVGTIFPSFHASSVDSFEDMRDSHKTPEKRFAPHHQQQHQQQHQKHRRFQQSAAETGKDSPTFGALQFVPAYEESTSPDTTVPMSSPDDSTSWDAIARDDVAAGAGRRPRYAASQILPKNDKSFGRCDDQLSEASRSTGVGGKGNRMGRLASLFSSRAVVKSMNGPSFTPMEMEAKARVMPPSPPRSESSAGYVGWPGTQDRRGGTVQVQSSYEDSDGGPSRNTKRNYQQEADEAADREITIWMDEEQSFESQPENDPNQYEKFRTPKAVSFQENAADFHLAAALADVTAAASSPMATTSRGSPRRNVTVGRSNAPRNVSTPSVTFSEQQQVVSPMTDPWGIDTSSDTLSEPETTLSKTSSAYFNDKDLGAFNDRNILRNKRKAAATVMRMKPGVPQPPTEEMLALKDRLSPPHRTFNATNAKGYRGLLDKTKDVPNLMDGSESDSTSSRATSSHSSAVMSTMNSQYRSRSSSRPINRLGTNEEVDEQIHEEASSDVFDGVASNAGSSSYGAPLGAGARNPYSNNSRSNDIPNQCNSLNIVLLGGGLTTIQTTPVDFSNRITASDFDENLTNSDCDQYGFTRIPGFNEMASAGRHHADRSFHEDDSIYPISASPARRIVKALESHSNRFRVSSNPAIESDSGSSLFSDPYPREGWGHSAVGDLSQYYVHPDEMKLLVRSFRQMAKLRSESLTGEDLQLEEDATKAFALSEMRSRIMEKDIERGLERRGGTSVVDDIVLTNYHRSALRVRDAVIVSKAWRDGASPRDVINTHLLTQGSERAHFIKRLVRNQGTPYFAWEEVLWVDDTDFVQFRCSSLGARHLRGLEMFTIGDCQSILLKLSNDRCLELRAELTDATARQIEAEELMKEDQDTAVGLMTEAEMIYLTSMEEVKNISRKLVVAEKSFTLVRDRIQKLVKRYEHLLLKFEHETESVATSSVISYESSYYSDDYSDCSEDDRERDLLARRAQREELRAEVVAREALLAKQHQSVRAEKERELHALQVRLSELQSESSAALAEREHSLVLARAITAKRVGSGGLPTPRDRISKSKIDGVKQRFRDRMAAKLASANASEPESVSVRSPSPATGPSYHGRFEHSERSDLFRTVGEEMYQHLDFYERSLKAVESTRAH